MGEALLSYVGSMTEENAIDVTKYKPYVLEFTVTNGVASAKSAFSGQSWDFAILEFNYSKDSANGSTTYCAAYGSKRTVITKASTSIGVPRISNGLGGSSTLTPIVFGITAAATALSVSVTTDGRSSGTMTDFVSITVYIPQ